MKLEKLQLEFFRNYQALNLELPKDANKLLIIGDNGQGKTNIVESIYLLSFAKSFRSKKIKDLVSWKQEYTRIKGWFNQDLCLEVFLSQPQKATKKNEIMIAGDEFIGCVNTVVFHPQDMNLLMLSPDLRRKYFNLLASQVDHGYLYALISYNKILKQRNQLLAQIQLGRAKDEECFFWDQQLVSYAAIIIEKRQSMIQFLNQQLTDFYRRISGNKERVKIKYKSLCNFKEMTIDDIRLELSSKLLEKKDSDLRYGYTSVGPHRDDVMFLLDGKQVETHGSRGECRTLMIALKLVEIEYILAEKKQRPILLLDDVFSELDDKRQKLLLESIDHCQTFITSTSSNGLEKMADTVKFVVKGGTVEKTD